MTTAISPQSSRIAKKLEIIWETLPPDFVLPDDPVDNIAQPLLALALREALEIAGLIVSTMLFGTDFGICTKVNGRTVIKAPDWVYVPRVMTVMDDRRSYTPYTEGDPPALVMEFLSDTDGTEYSTRPIYPYGKWYFYEQILQVPNYVIFDPYQVSLEFYDLVEGQYQAAQPTTNPQPESYQQSYWVDSLQLFLGVWQGTKAERTGYWLRWWDSSGNLLPWGKEKLDQEQHSKAQLQQQVLAAEQRANQLAERLRALGIDPEDI